jgi:Dynein heavy chain, N-terminal region 1
MQDLPSIAGTLIWAWQIEQQLITYMKCIKNILRKGWELYAEGQKLQSKSTTFQKKLKTCLVFKL